MHADADVDIQDTEICHRGFFRLDRLTLRHRRFDGGWTPPLTREVLLRGPAVAVLPYDPVRDEIVLIEQFRAGNYAAGRPGWMTEIVAGITDQGEAPEDVARREMREETGLAVGDLEFVAEFLPSPGGSSEVVRLYCGRVDATSAGGIHGVDGESEDIRVLTMSTNDALAWLDSGQVDNAVTLIGLLWLGRHRDRLRLDAGA
ncbi:MAG: NUDIX domain-containing protein [Inquilinus sp.]|nr:NUDIX domain-containing protein [Inquilinus sp.]